MKVAEIIGIAAKKMEFVLNYLKINRKKIEHEKSFFLSTSFGGEPEE